LSFHPAPSSNPFSSFFLLLFSQCRPDSKLREDCNKPQSPSSPSELPFPLFPLPSYGKGHMRSCAMTVWKRQDKTFTFSFFFFPFPFPLQKVFFPSFPPPFFNPPVGMNGEQDRRDPSPLSTPFFFFFLLRRRQ